MSVRIALDNRPEFYTNLDVVAGRVVLGLNRSEQVSSIVVKLEGESVTALQPPRYANGDDARTARGPPESSSSNNPVGENHKILYKLQQVFPDEHYASQASPYGAQPLTPGEHVFPFKFKLPINNACSDPMAMSKIGGLGGIGGFGSGGGLFGIGGVRVMDGSKQLFLHHVTQTLPPSLTGFPMEAEIRYYVKVTIQRPGLLKENWRFQVGFKFLPIEPPRPKVTGQESFARRPFTFRTPSPHALQGQKKRGSFFPKKGEAAKAAEAKAAEARAADSKAGDSSTSAGDASSAPSIEMSARIPHPSVLTCNKPIPLRLIAKKLVDSPGQVYLKSLQIDLIGITQVRAQQVSSRRLNRWVVFTDANLEIPVCSPSAAVGQEVPLPDDLWKNVPLPNTIAPSFATCNLGRQYQLEIKLGLVWGKPKTSILKGNNPFAPTQPQAIHLPLHFNDIQIFSGITPPTELVKAARSTKPGRVTMNMPPKLPPRTSAGGSSAGAGVGTSSSGAAAAPPAQPPRPQNYVPVRPPTLDPLYPPQLSPGQEADDAPPSYDEAMAENLSGPFDGINQQRPAYSGVTNENAPSQMPEKS